ncbi:MAG: radical SAM protein [Bacteroidales bacterium]|nr:radical SAM protein [Bacteroidales bacterium]
MEKRVSIASNKSQLNILVCKPRLAIQTIRMNRFIRCEPLELEYLNTVLGNHKLTLLDGIIDRRDPVKIASRCKAQIVLFTSLITTITEVLKIAGQLKQLDQPPLIFVGGPHAEVVPESFFSPHIDGIFFANQLEGIVKVVQHIQDNTPYHHVPGGVFRINNQMINNPSAPLDPLRMQRPKHTLLEKDPNRYRIIYYKPCATIKTSFGCMGKCTFCFCSEMHAGGYGARPMADVIDEIEEIPVNNILILDDNFLISRKRLLEFYELMKEKKLKKKFIAIGNARFIAENPDVMEKLKSVGLNAMMVGFEFVSNEELQEVHKDATINDNMRTIQVCKNLDIDLFALFIINPDWTHADFRKLAAYLKENEIPFALYSTLTVFPGTKMAKNGAAYESDPNKWWRYDLLRLHKKPLHMSKLAFYLWLFYLYMVPGMKFTTLKKHRLRYGNWGVIKHAITSFFMGMEYMVKLLIWP